MKRREFIGLLPAPYLATVIGAGFVAAGCNPEPTTGPIDIKWDRDIDPRCSMVIGDKRFAAQIRDQNRKVWKFDDIGCAVFWLAHQQFNEETARVEFWINDYENPGQWLDARQAHYVAGKKSPMGYHYGAVKTATPDSVPYAEMKKRILARGK